MSVTASVQQILIDTLQLPSDTRMEEGTQLLGAIPEFDSMAIVTVITTLEENFGFIVDDDEIDAEVFETFGALCDFVEQKQ